MSLHENSRRTNALREERRSLEAEAAKFATYDRLSNAQEARFVDVNDRLSAIRDELEDLREERLAEAHYFAKRGGIKPVTEKFNVNTRTTPFETDRLTGLAPERRDAEARAMALDVVERHTDLDHIDDTARQHATKLIERGGDVARDVAELAITVGSPEYRQAFARWVREPQSISARLDLERMAGSMDARAAVSIAGTAGAVAMPFALDSTILLTNAGVVSPIRQVCRNVQITGTNSWQAPTTSGISAAVLGESTTVTDNTPTFTSTNIPVYKQAAWAFGSFEALGDADLASEMAQLFADAKNRLEGTKFATGTGVNEPQGIVTFYSNATSVIAGTSGAANSADLIAADIYTTRQSLSPRWRDRAVWFMNLSVLNSIRQLGTANNYHAFTLDLTQSSDNMQLLGKRAFEVSDFDGVITSGSTDFCLLHHDPTTFVVVDRVGMQVMYEPLILSTGAARPTGEAGWFAFYRSGSGGLAQDAGRLLKL